MYHLVHLFVLIDVAEDAVIGTDEIVVIRHYKDRAARRADTGIDHGQMSGETREYAAGVKQSERRSEDILRRDLMCDIDQLRVRIDRKDNSLHRRDKVVLSSEVREQCDYRSFLRHRPISYHILGY